MAEDQRLVVRGTGDLADAFLPPYGPVAQAIVDSVFQTAADPKPLPERLTPMTTRPDALPRRAPSPSAGHPT